MHRIIALIIIFVLYGSTDSTVHAESMDDLAAISETAKQYMESWYQGNAEIMEVSLHPELAKRSIKAGSDGRDKLKHTTASDMVLYTMSGYGKDLWQENYSIKVVVLDFYKDIASVKVIAPHYLEYLHLVKTDKKWVIINALYQNKAAINK